MTYGSESVIPLKTGFPTLRMSLFTLDNNDRLSEKSLDLINERSCHGSIGILSAEAQTGVWYRCEGEAIGTYRSTGETSFSMTYGFESVIPLKTGFPTLKMSLFTLDNNDRLLEKSLDLINERSCHGSIGILSAEAQTGVWYRCEGEAIGTRWFDIGESCGYRKEPIMGKIRAQLGRAIPYHLSS